MAPRPRLRNFGGRREAPPKGIARVDDRGGVDGGNGFIAGAEPRSGGLPAAVAKPRGSERPGFQGFRLWTRYLSFCIDFIRKIG